MTLDRRSVLRGVAACTAAGLLPSAWASAPLTVPQVDLLELTIVVDDSVTVFAEAVDKPDFKATPAPPTPDYHTTYAAQWGFSVLARAASRTVLVDFGTAQMPCWAT